MPQNWKKRKKLFEVWYTPNFKPKQLPSLTKYICYEVGVVCTRIDANMVLRHYGFLYEVKRGFRRVASQILSANSTELFIFTNNGQEIFWPLS